MELSERAIQTLEIEGCTSVSEADWSPAAAIVLRADHSPLYVYVTEGVLSTEQSGVLRTYRAGERLEVAPQATLTATAGSAGCRAVLGE